MKCPACTFVSSDLRDICPKCLSDLRPHKRLLNIAITDPNSSYEELKAKYRSAPKPPGAGSASEPKIKSLTSFTKRLFGSAPAKSDHKKSEEKVDLFLWKRNKESETVLSPAAVSESHTPSLSNEALISHAPIVATTTTTIVETDLNIPETPQSLGMAFVEKEEDHEEPKAVAPGETIRQVETPVTNKEQSSDEVFVEVTAESEEVVGDVIESMLEASQAEAQIVEPETSQEEPIVEPEVLKEESDLRSAFLQESPSEIKEPAVENEASHSEKIEEPYIEPEMSDDAAHSQSAFEQELSAKPPEPESTLKPYFATEQDFETSTTNTTSHQKNSASLDEEFSIAFESLGQDTAQGIVDLSAVTSYSPMDNEHIELLFALAKERLDPNFASHALTEKIATSEGRVLESTELEKRLNEVEKIINFVETPRTLSDIAKQTIVSSAKRFASARPKRERLDAPRPVVRLLAWFCDCAAILFISLAITSLFEDKDLATQFAELSSAKLDATERIPLLMSALSIAPLVGLIYWCLTFASLHSSLGGKIFGIFVVAENGRKAKLTHTLVRALTIPISTIFLGFLPILTGHRSFSDRLAHTYTVRRVTWKDLEAVSKA